MRYAFHILDVFTDRPFGGNQLAVLPEAAGIDDARMQAVAAEFGFSETTFVLPPTRSGHDCRVRIFTPRHEMPFAGHPTIGTAIALANLGRAPAGRVVMEQIAGTVPVEIRSGSPVEAELTAPKLPSVRDAPHGAGAAALAGVAESEMLSAHVASAGAAFLFVELRSLDALARAKPPFGLDADAEGLVLFTRDTGSRAHDLRMRMFAPHHGIAEDPATGSAAAALGGLLAMTGDGGDGWQSWRIGQGIEMGRPSLLRVRARREAGTIAEIRVAGAAVTVAEGTIEVP